MKVINKNDVKMLLLNLRKALSSRCLRLLTKQYIISKVNYFTVYYYVSEHRSKWNHLKLFLLATDSWPRFALVSAIPFH